MILDAPFKGRSGFGPFLNGLGLTGIAAEVGTHRGEFAVDFLSRWKGSRLYCIDPWISGYNELDPVSQRTTEERLTDKRAAEKSLSSFNERASIMQVRSLIAARRFNENQLSFVYLDGDHSAEAIKVDLKAWWPRIAAGGILAGHDWEMPHIADFPWRHTVTPAVTEFSGKKGLDIFVVTEDDLDLAWSWYIMKDKADD